MSNKAEMQEYLKEMQNIQQNLQVLLMQKQNISVQMSEIKNALEEVMKTENTELYEIVGTVMLKKTKDELKASLEEKKDILDLRLSTLEKQIKKFTEDSKDIQKKIVGGKDAK